jgi:hypothetical protein|tara:strand:- start:1161 stop:1331 length:171 start_codon:yes stop_codon:yes gene_type:complete
MQFTDALTEYLELKDSDEKTHPQYDDYDGYTNKLYYRDLQKAEDRVNAFFDFKELD